MNVYNQTSEDHLYDDNHENFYQNLNQGRTKDQVECNHAILYYLFMIGIAALALAGLFCLFAYAYTL